MKRLRTRNHSRSRKAAPVLSIPVTLAVIVVTSLSLTYLWLHSRCGVLAMTLTAKEKRLSDIGHQLNAEQLMWADMTSPKAMKAHLANHRILMISQFTTNVVFLGDAPGTAIPAPLHLAQGRGVQR